MLLNQCHIKTVRITSLQDQLIMPFRVATGQHDTLDNILLTITLDNGVKGFGEAAVATHITGETIPQTIKTLEKIIPALEGADIGEYLNLCAKARVIASQNKCALAATEMAIMDALTRHLNFPLWKMWGNEGQRLIKFTTDITIVIGSLEETVAATRLFYQQGFRAFKIKIGRDMDLDIKRVMAVKSIVGKSTILLDANQGYSAKQALAFLKVMKKARIDIALIEQPVPKNDWEGLKEVTRKTTVVVCADESVSSVKQAVRAIKEKAVGAINIKLMKTAMIDAVAIMQLAKANNVKLMMGGMMETSLAMTASAHLVAGLGGVDFVDLDTPFFIKKGLSNNPFLSSKGVYDLRLVKAGIGIKP